MIEPSAEWHEQAFDLTAWSLKEGFASFVLVGLEDGDVRYIGPDLSPRLVATMLKTLASEFERRAEMEAHEAPGDRTLQ